jgi:rubrerythrin
MDILGYALKFEKDGEAFYRESAAEVGDKNIADILLFLAREEQNHYKMIKDVGKVIQNRPASIFISDIQNIFSAMKEKQEKFTGDKSSILDIFERALAIEDESIKYYEQKQKEVDNPKAKELLGILRKQEDAHYSLLSSLIEYYDRPYLWLENAEFNQIKEY